MPTFSAIALERLIEPGASNSADKTVPPAAPNYPPLPKPKLLVKTSSLPGPQQLERRNSSSNLDRKPSRPQLSPALYATPEATPLPDSSSSYTPSPYVVNHKRRGPRLLKSASEADVASREKDGSEVDQAKVIFGLPKGNLGSVELVCENGFHDSSAGGEFGEKDGEVGSSNRSDGVVVAKDDDLKLAAAGTDRDVDEDDFFDPQESMSYTSNTDVEESGAESLSQLFGSARASEFYDAWEELSSESGQQFSSLRDIETELREMRLNLLMEIEKRKQAEEALSSMLSHWQKVRQQLALVGLTLPAYPVDIAESTRNVEPAKELCQQVYITRFVANSIGRGTAKAEMEIEMEAQMEAKNFEMARLLDRLHYYEAMNQEMSQRNQEAVEVVRQKRLTRRRRQRWVWGSIAAAITLGTAALTWSYLGPDRGPHSSLSASPLDHDDAPSEQ